MPSLREIQARCLNAFLLGDDHALPRALRQYNRPAAIQMAVYQNNARETYQKALYASYPVIASLAGRDCFEGLAEKYRSEYPSASGDLMQFGSRFPEFLQGLYGDTNYAYFTDVAHLEWACEEVLTTSECKPVLPDQVRSLYGDACLNIRFKVADQARLISSDYPILDIWRAHQSAVLKTVDLDQGPDHIVVQRRRDDAVMSRISPGAFELAHEFRRCVTLGDVFESWTAVYDAGDFGQALEELLATGLLCDLSL